MANDKLAYFLKNSSIPGAAVVLRAAGGVDYMAVIVGAGTPTSSAELCSHDLTNRDLTRYQALGVQRLRIVNTLPSGATNLILYGSGPYWLEAFQDTDTSSYIVKLVQNGITKITSTTVLSPCSLQASA